MRARGLKRSREEGKGGLEPALAVSPLVVSEPSGSMTGSGLEKQIEELQAQNVPYFIANTFVIVSNPANKDIVRWNPDGKAFVVLDEHRFAVSVLPQHFRHNNMSSFVRQLNFYGFKKWKKDTIGPTFFHPSFVRNRPDLLTEIKRQMPKAGSGSGERKSVKEAIAKLTKEVETLKTQYTKIWEHHNQVVMILARLLNESRVKSYKRPRMIASPAKGGRLQIEDAPRPVVFESEFEPTGEDGAHDPDVRAQLLQLTSDVSGLAQGIGNVGAVDATGLMANMRTPSQQQQQQAVVELINDDEEQQRDPPPVIRLGSAPTAPNFFLPDSSGNANGTSFQIETMDPAHDDFWPYALPADPLGESSVPPQ